MSLLHGIHVFFFGNLPTSPLRCRGAPNPDEYMDPEFGDESAEEGGGESAGGDPESRDQVIDPAHAHLFVPQDFKCDDDDDDLAPVCNGDDAELDGEHCFFSSKVCYFSNPIPETIRKLWGMNLVSLAKFFLERQQVSKTKYKV